jgi:hypothetical protein
VERCPCCGYRTIDDRGLYDICQVCYWEDDGQDDHNADVILGSPNKSLSLTVARRNFQEFGACDRRYSKFVRKPTPDEH